MGTSAEDVQKDVHHKVGIMNPYQKINIGVYPKAMINCPSKMCPALIL